MDQQIPTRGFNFGGWISGSESGNGKGNGKGKSDKSLSDQIIESQHLYFQEIEKNQGKEKSQLNIWKWVHRILAHPEFENFRLKNQESKLRTIPLKIKLLICSKFALVTNSILHKYINLKDMSLRTGNPLISNSLILEYDISLDQLQIKGLLSEISPKIIDHEPRSPFIFGCTNGYFKILDSIPELNEKLEQKKKEVLVLCQGFEDPNSVLFRDLFPLDMLKLIISNVYQTE